MAIIDEAQPFSDPPIADGESAHTAASAVTGASAVDAADLLAVETAASEAAACLFNGMADPSRMAILRHLLLGEHNVAQLTEHLGLAQSTVSKHLACLRGCGLVESRAVGRSSMYSIVHADDVLALFVAAERLLAKTGDTVVLCPMNPDSPTAAGRSSAGEPSSDDDDERGV